MSEEFEYYTAVEAEDGTLNIYGHGRYGSDSILEGQPRKAFVTVCFDWADAKATFPGIYDQHPAFDFERPAGEAASPPADWDPADAGESWHEEEHF